MMIESIIRVPPNFITTVFLTDIHKRAAASNYKKGFHMGFWRTRPIPELPPMKKRITSGIIPAVTGDLAIPEDIQWANALLWWSYGLINPIKPSAIIKAVGLRSLEEYQFALDCLGAPLSKTWNRFKALHTIEMVIGMITPKTVARAQIEEEAVPQSKRIQPIRIVLEPGPSQHRVEVSDPPMTVIPAAQPERHTAPEMATIIEENRDILKGTRIFPYPFAILGAREFEECLWLVACFVAKPSGKNMLLARYNVQFRANIRPLDMEELTQRVTTTLTLPQLWSWQQRPTIGKGVLHACNELWFAIHGDQSPMDTVIQKWTQGDRDRFHNILIYSHVPLRPVKLILPAIPTGLSPYEEAEYQAIAETEYGMVDISTTLHNFRIELPEYHRRRRRWKIVNTQSWMRYLETARRDFLEVTPDRARRVMDALFLLRADGLGKEHAMRKLGVTTDQELAERLTQDGLTVPFLWLAQAAITESTDDTETS